MKIAEDLELKLGINLKPQLSANGVFWNFMGKVTIGDITMDWPFSIGIKVFELYEESGKTITFQGKIIKSPKEFYDLKKQL